MAALRCTHKSFQDYFTSNMSLKKRGVMIANKDLVSFQSHSETSYPSGCFLIIVCGINAICYMLVNVYVPNKHQV